MADLPEAFNVPLTDSAKCPVCHNPIVLQCLVRITGASVRVTGGDNFSSSMSATISAKVVSVVADHGCTPKKED